MLCVLAGCSQPAATGPSPAPRELLNVAMTGAPETLNPILSTSQFEIQAEMLALDPLVATDPEGRDVPILAATVPTLENGGISPDGLTITYHLRHGVVWQDGASFGSRDVRFTWRAIMNPDTAVSTRHGYDDIASVDTPDTYTAVFHLKRRFAPAVHTFFAHSDSPIAILPAHILERYRNLNDVPFNSRPIGTGPYQIVRWQRGDRIEYVANDRYFLGKPGLRRIVVHLIPDENTVIEQMRTHEIDWFVPGFAARVSAVTFDTGHRRAARLVQRRGFAYLQYQTRAVRGPATASSRRPRNRQGRTRPQSNLRHDARGDRRSAVVHVGFQSAGRHHQARCIRGSCDARERRLVRRNRRHPYQGRPPPHARHRLPHR